MKTPAEGESSEKTESTTTTESTAASTPATESSDQKPSELPAEVKAKLRRLDKLESRYHGMSSRDKCDNGTHRTNPVIRTPQSVPCCAFACSVHRTIRSRPPRKHSPHLDRRTESAYRVSQPDVAQDRYGGGGTEARHDRPGRL